MENGTTGDYMIHMEVRKKVVAARQRGLRIKEIANAYGYSESAINRLLRRHRECGDIAPRTYLRGRKPALQAGELESMRQLILGRPDITLEEIKETMQLTISVPAICKIVKNKLGFEYKKRQYMPVNEIDLMS